MLLGLANTASWAEDLQLLPSLSNEPRVGPGQGPAVLAPSFSLFSDFKARLEAVIARREVAGFADLYQTNGVTAEELESELVRWRHMAGEDAKTVFLFFKELSKLPPESHEFWSAEAHRLTKHEVTHFAFVRSGSRVRLILPLFVVDDKLLIVPSEKIIANGVEPSGPASQPIRSETNRTSPAAGSRR